MDKFKELIIYQCDMNNMNLITTVQNCTQLSKTYRLKIVLNLSKYYLFDFKNHKISCQQMIVKLFWLQDELFSPCDYFQPIMTSYGLCYSLNMIPHQLLYSESYYKTYVLINSYGVM